MVYEKAPKIYHLILILINNPQEPQVKRGISKLIIAVFQDENDCLSAWVSARETGLSPNDAVDQKVNYGGLLLQALLEHWPKPCIMEDESDPEGLVRNIVSFL